MFCKYCGQEIADDSVFCEKCGKNVKGFGDYTNEGPSVKKGTSSSLVENKGSVSNEPDTWYYMDGTEMDGPLTAETIRRKIVNGVIDSDAKVRRNTIDPWRSLADSPFADVAIQMKSEPISISDKWVWCLSVIPMAIMILLYYLKVIPAEGAASWIVPFVINTVFFLLDKKELEEKGFYPEGWMWMGILLIPIYIVVREVKTNRNFVPAIIWCFLFSVETFIL